MNGLEIYTILVMVIHFLLTMRYLGIDKTEDSGYNEVLESLKLEKILIFFCMLPIYFYSIKFITLGDV